MNVLEEVVTCYCICGSHVCTLLQVFRECLCIYNLLSLELMSDFNEITTLR